MPLIRSLQSKLTRAGAIQRLMPGGASGMIAIMRRGPLRAVAEVHVPLRLYAISIENAGRRDTRLFAQDAVKGELDLWRFDSIPGDGDIVPVETPNCLPAELGERESRELTLEKVRRLLFSERGFFRIRKLSLSAELVECDLHAPYWVGFYGDPERLRMVAIDAVRGCREGAKINAMFAEWLRGAPSSSQMAFSG